MVEPGIYPNMTDKEYHRGMGREALSKSLLVELAKSPAHCLHAMENEQAPTKAQELGSAVHCAVLEPDRFQWAYKVFSGDRRTKAGRAEYQGIIDAGQAPLSETDMAQIQGMSQAVHEHPICKDLLQAGMAEVSLFWRAKTWGVPCKARPDWLNPYQQLILDLKTTTDASPGAFSRDAARYRYHWQVAWYLQSVETVLGPGPWRFVFVAVEKAPPFGVGVYALPEETIDAAREQIRPLISEYWHARELQNWPGYPDDIIQTLSLPMWALNTEVSYE